jgi:hypothetical protein
LPVQFGWQQVEPVHLSPAVHVQSVGHVLQSSPIAELHEWSPHEALAMHLPETHKKPDPHAGPQVPPQPSSPHCLPVQLGVQQLPATQRPAPQLQSPGHESHVSPGSHCPLPQYACPVQCPS